MVTVEPVRVLSRIFLIGGKSIRALVHGKNFA